MCHIFVLLVVVIMYKLEIVEKKKISMTFFFPSQLVLWTVVNMFFLSSCAAVQPDSSGFVWNVVSSQIHL